MIQKMKTVGIIGGLGPETTAEFYMEIIKSSFKENKINRPPILIWNVPLQLKIEEDLIIKSKGEERYIPFLIEAAERLEQAGADFLVMPCNSLHIFIEEIRNAVRIPVISIVDETLMEIKKENIKQIGILATSTSLNSKLFQDALEKINVEVHVPKKYHQLILGQIIHNLVMNKKTKKDRANFKMIVKALDKKNILLACTDLQLILKKQRGIKVSDTMKILADAAVRELTS